MNNKRTKKRLNFPVLVLAGILSVVFAVQFVAQTNPDKSTLEPGRSGLTVVNFPDLKELEPEVSAQLQAVRDALVKESASTESSNERLGNAYAQCAMMFHAYSFPETALESYSNAAVLLPKEFQWRHLLGTVLIELQRPMEAVEQFKLSAKLNPEYVATYLHSGNALLDLDLLDTARVAFELAARRSPESPAVLFGLGRLEYAQKNFQKAAEHFEKVLELVPQASRVHYTLALAYRNLNQPEKAKFHIEKQGPIGIAVNDPVLENIEQFRSGDRLKMIAAKSAMDGKLYGEAARLYSDILTSDPDNITALVNISAAFVELKKYTDAAVMLEKAVKIAPDNSNAHFNLGVLYSLTKKPFQAIGSFKNVLRVNPNDAETRYLLAKELAAADLQAEAKIEFERVTDQNPNNEEALIALVRILTVRGEHADVMKRLSHAYSLYPTRPWTVAAYAFALAKSPDKTLRNGELALEISRKIYDATRMTEHGFLVVLSLVELGRCQNAVDLGKKFVEKAKQEKQEALAANLESQVLGFEKPGGCVQTENQ